MKFLRLYFLYRGWGIRRMLALKTAWRKVRHA